MVHVGSVVIDCNDFSRMLAFWQEALRYVPKYPPKENDWALLRDPEGRHVNVSLQCVPEKRVGKNRLHLDLYTNDPDAEIERLLELGATVHGEFRIPMRSSWCWKTPRGTCSASWIHARGRGQAQRRRHAYERGSFRRR